MALPMWMRVLSADAERAKLQVPQVQVPQETFNEGDTSSEDGSCSESGGEDDSESGGEDDSESGDVEEDQSKVIDSTRDSRGRLTGLLLGTVSETAFGGEAPAYTAHYLCAPAKYGMASFAFGDFVRSTTDASSTMFAIIIRVIYVARKAPEQGRKLLILRGFKGASKGAYFPGSWADWERVPHNLMDPNLPTHPHILVTDELLQILRVSCSKAHCCKLFRSTLL